MRTISLPLFLLLTGNLYAQVVIKPQVIASAGKSFQKTNAGVTFTVGEIVVKPMKSNGDVSLSNGVIASAVPFLVSKVFTSQNEIHFQLYPNPSTAQAVFKMDSKIDEPILLRVNDLQGKVMFEQNLPHNFNTYSFDVRQWATGMYLLSVYNQKSDLLGYIKFQKQ